MAVLLLGAMALFMVPGCGDSAAPSTDTSDVADAVDAQILDVPTLDMPVGDTLWPEVAPDAAPELPQDIAAEVPDIAPELPDVPGDVPPDVAPDVAPGELEVVEHGAACLERLELLHAEERGF